MKKLFILLFVLFSVQALAQEVVFSGRVTDALTGEGMPFVSVYFKNSSIGTTTNIEGNFTFKAVPPTDSLTCSYVGYLTSSRKITAQKAQVISFRMEAATQKLGEVVVRPTENPAFKVIRRAAVRKEANSKAALSAYQYETYNKIELDVDNLTDAFKSRTVVKPLKPMLDSLKLIAGEEGGAYLPVFISESLTDFYYRRNPDRKKEKIKATKISGIGMEDGSVVSQLIGSAYQEYNFYENRLNVLNKEFVSPIADAWKLYYDYDLEDSLMVGNNWCYKLKVIPRREQDLVFSGYIWLDAQTYALKKLDLSVGKSANLNFIEKVRVRQESEQTSAGPWITVKTRLLVKIASIGKNRPGMLARIHTSARNVIVNQPLDPEFYQNVAGFTENPVKTDAAFWNEHRHDSLSATEKQVYALVDSVRNLPIVRSYVEIANILLNGYKPIGKIDVGPYPYFYAFNNVEGHRFQVGFRTNSGFSRTTQFSGFAAYGTRDGRLKYKAAVRFILSRRHWSEAGISDKEDLEQVGLNTDKVEDNALFMASNRFGELKRPYRRHETAVWVQRELVKGLTQRITMRQRSFNPLFPFSFVTGNPENGPELEDRFSTSEVVLDTRFANNEIFLQSENDRISLGNKGWPTFRVRYSLGLKNTLGSDIAYHRLEGSMQQLVPMGILGKGEYLLQAGQVFSAVPYPLLEVHLGNETPFYTRSSFNLMNYFEFASDKYVSLHYNQHFEGLGMNNLPLIRKLKWRLVASGNLLYGNLNTQNQALLATRDQNGNSLDSFARFKAGVPYAEVGYGFENIFKFIRVQAFHRLTYLSVPGANNFGLKVSAQFQL